MRRIVHSSWFIVHGSVLVIGLLCYMPCMAFAQGISSTELIKNAKQYDGKTVVYEGEVIGDVMVRGQYAWVNMNDGNNAIGIWMNKDLARGIEYTASYSAKGDWVEVTGVFSRSCLQHGGDLDIHAQLVRRISPGRLVKEKINIDKRNQAIIFLGAVVLIWILSLLKKK